MYYQQGDVIIERVGKVAGKKLPHLTLAKGETTGHHHTVTIGEAVLYEEKGTLYLHVESDKAQVTHQEHGSVTLPKGDYRIRQVQEYDHFAEEARKVND